MKKVCYGVFVFIIIVTDQIIKMLMMNRNIDILKDIVSLSYTENTNAAFSIGNYYIVTIGSLGIIIILLILLFIYRSKVTNFLPIILILSGGISNLIDRIFRGFVIDYISIFSFPVFNIADICIVMGTIIIIIQIIYGYIKKEKV